MSLQPCWARDIKGNTNHLHCSYSEEQATEWFRRHEHKTDAEVSRCTNPRDKLRNPPLRKRDATCRSASAPGEDTRGSWRGPRARSAAGEEANLERSTPSHEARSCHEAPHPNSATHALLPKSYLSDRVAVMSAKNHKRQRRKHQSVTAKREKSQTPKALTAILTLPNLT